MGTLKGRVLIVAGSDSGGGAGIQADIKAVSAMGAYSATAVTAITVQNTKGVFGVHGVPPETIAAQMRAVLEDIGADVIKTGMLHNRETIEAVAGVLDDLGADIPLVMDPVMVAKGGARLVDEEAEAMVREVMIPRAALITPNLPEAQALLGRPIADAGAMDEAALALRALGPRAVLLKGGHLEGDILVDVLAQEGEVARFEGERIQSRHTHGTGCTMASAIAALLARGMVMKEAVALARTYVFEAIRSAPGLGEGHGPLNHMHGCPPFEGRD